MRNRILKYPTLTVCDVSLDPGEQFTFKGGGASGCIGTIYVHGVIAPAGETAWAEIAENRAYRPRSAWGGWKRASETEAEGEAVFQAGPDGARWLCCIQNETGPREIYGQSIDGQLVVPAGFDVLVAWVGPDGVTIGGVPATTGDLMARRKEDAVVLGEADLLLIR